MIIYFSTEKWLLKFERSTVRQLLPDSVELVGPKDQCSFTNRAKDSLCGQTSVAVLDENHRVALDLNNTSYFPGRASLGPFSGEDKQDDVAYLCPSSPFFLVARHKQVDSVNENRKPFTENSSIPVKLALGAVVNDDVSLELTEIVPA